MHVLQFTYTAFVVQMKMKKTNIAWHLYNIPETDTLVKEREDSGEERNKLKSPIFINMCNTTMVAIVANDRKKRTRMYV